MTTTINASPTNGLVQTADGSGVLKCQSNGVTTNALAWVNFNGVTTTTIRASYNVSSVTRGGTGVYTITFTNAMSDANYTAPCVASTPGSSIGFVQVPNTSGQSASALNITTTNTAGTGTDQSYVHVAIFGN